MRVASRFERKKGSWTKKKPFSWHGIWGYEKKVVSLQGNVVCTIHRKTCALVLENGGLVVRIKGWAKVRQRFGNGSAESNGGGALVFVGSGTDAGQGENGAHGDEKLAFGRWLGQ